MSVRVQPLPPKAQKSPVGAAPVVGVSADAAGTGRIVPLDRAPITTRGPSIARDGGAATSLRQELRRRRGRLAGGNGAGGEDDCGGDEEELADHDLGLLVGASGSSPCDEETFADQTRRNCNPLHTSAPFSWAPSFVLRRDVKAFYPPLYLALEQLTLMVLQTFFSWPRPSRDPLITGGRRRHFKHPLLLFTHRFLALSGRT